MNAILLVALASPAITATAWFVMYFLLRKDRHSTRERWEVINQYLARQRILDEQLKEQCADLSEYEYNILFGNLHAIERDALSSLTAKPGTSAPSMWSMHPGAAANATQKRVLGF